MLLALATPPAHSAEPVVDPAWPKANPGTTGVHVREDIVVTRYGGFGAHDSAFGMFASPQLEPSRAPLDSVPGKQGYH